MRYISIFIIALTSLSLSCKASLKVKGNGAAPATVEDKAAKLTSDECTDPDLSKVASDQSFMLCDGTIASGTYSPDFPDAENVLTSDTVNGVAGTYASTAPNEWDLRWGVTAGSVTGKLKVNCRNMVDLDSWDNSGSLADGGLDVFDTTSDYNASNPTYPTANPWGSDEHLCGYGSLVVAERTWERATTTPATSGASSVYTDKISGLKWSRGNEPAATGAISAHWDNVAAATAGGTADMGALGAIEYCDGLDHGGIAAWRLPTQKELKAAYGHGIHDLDVLHTATDNLGDFDGPSVGRFWSSSTRLLSDGGALNAWSESFVNGYALHSTKVTSLGVICVSP